MSWICLKVVFFYVINVLKMSFVRYECLKDVLYVTNVKETLFVLCGLIKNFQIPYQSLRVSLVGLLSVVLSSLG